jgi:uncharacterized protein
VKLSLRTARRLAVARQHLSGRAPRRPGPGSIMDLMGDISYVQLDPTSAVAQSHLLVLWSRLGAFRESDLDRLLWKDRKLFEYWAHKASIVRTEDYPLYLPRMKQFARGDTVWHRRLREWMDENSGLRNYILDELRRRGPLPSREFEDRSKVAWHSARRKWGLRQSGWSTGRSASHMLGFMFHEGRIMVAGRQGRQKVWDLSERCLPAWTPKKAMSPGEVEYVAAQKSLRGLGVATAKQVASHFLSDHYADAKGTLESLASDSKVVHAEIVDGRPAKGKWYLHADDLRLVEDLERGEWEPRTTLLSPFDNLIADRDRTLQLFDFFYRVEIYTPRAKRKHGFFVLPILDGDRLIGRIDPFMDRREERLHVRAVYAEPGAPEGRAPAARISQAVESLAGFLGAKEVVYPSRVPEVWGSLR